MGKDVWQWRITRGSMVYRSDYSRGVLGCEATQEVKQYPRADDDDDGGGYRGERSLRCWYIQERDSGR